MTFPNQGKPYLRHEILGALSDIVDPKDIIGAGPLQDNSKWIFTLRNRDAVVKGLGSPPCIRGNQGRSFSLTKTLLTCRVHWLPLYLPMASVAVYMSRYGVVHSVAWDHSKIEQFTHVRLSVRTVVLEVEPDTDIASLDSLHYKDEQHKYLVTIPGRGAVCFHCSAVGHTRSTCTAPYCRHCQVYDHSTKDCTRRNSYAGRAAGRPEQQEQQEEPCDVEEEVESRGDGGDRTVDADQVKDQEQTVKMTPEKKSDGPDHERPHTSSSEEESGSESASEDGSITDNQDNDSFLSSSDMPSMVDLVKGKEPEIFTGSEDNLEDVSSVRKRFKAAGKDDKKKKKKKPKKKDGDTKMDHVS